MNLQYEIRPAAFYFNGKRTIGARAEKRNDYYSVSMNAGTVYEFHELFREHFTIDKHIPAGELLTLQETPLQYIMYQTAVLFLYYHELAHLIQMSDEDTYEFTEDLPLTDEAAYSREQHLRELDADLFAAQYTCDHIIQLLREHPNPDYSDLRDYTAAIITGLFSLFLQSQGGPQPIYFERYNHPHLMIRVTYVQDYITRRMAEIKPATLEFNGQEVMAVFVQAFHHRARIAFGGFNFNDYAQTIVDHQQPIETFVTRMLQSLHELPDLVINRQLRARQDP